MPPDGSRQRAGLLKTSHPEAAPRRDSKTPKASRNSTLRDSTSRDAVGTSLLCRAPGRRISRAVLQKFLEEIARRILRGRSVLCLLTGDDELRRLNRQFRGLDYATDVLSFPAGVDDLSNVIEACGEIAISLDRAAAQAAEHGHRLADEIRILMLHGVLHLSGMDHETDSGEMAEAEIRWRRRLDLPIGLIERSGQAGSRGIRKSRGLRHRGLPNRDLPSGTRA